MTQKSFNSWRSIAAFCLCAALPLAHAYAMTPDQIAERALGSVVLIKTANGLGTGFVVARDGRIATNLHVIGEAREAVVVLADGREFDKIEVLNHDVDHDLLLLRVAARDLAPLPLGDSAKVRVGERVVAIGHPLGLGNTVSDGLVSAVRKINPKLTVLQVSAPISPGSSGGPLLNDAGEVIGISTLIVTQGQNLNFGMPVNQLKALLITGKPVPLAAWKAPEGSGLSRKVPNHDASLLADCGKDELNAVRSSIEQAIKLGAPLYNDGNHEACYRIYAAAALDVNRTLAACPGPKRALLDGVARAEKSQSWSSKAWAMRDAFDGVLHAISRFDAAPPPAATKPGIAPRRHVPKHTAALLNGCSNDQIKYIGNAIVGAINAGAPLYNEGHIEACYRIYEGAILDVTRQAASCTGPAEALNAGLKQAATRASYTDKAWALRDAFDGVLDVLERRAK